MLTSMPFTDESHEIATRRVDSPVRMTRPEAFLPYSPLATSAGRRLWTSLRRTVLLTQGARENAAEAVDHDRARAVQRRQAARALDQAERTWTDRQLDAGRLAAVKPAL